jgi:cbb3-type cytochrome oxidase maturation protein
MDSLIILIPIALVFTGVAVAAFFWAVNTGQYDDLDRAARDILFDDEPNNDTGDNDNDSDEQARERKH